MWHPVTSRSATAISLACLGGFGLMLAFWKPEEPAPLRFEARAKSSQDEVYDCLFRKVQNGPFAKFKGVSTPFARIR